MSLPINKFKHQMTNNKQIPSASGGPMIQTLMNQGKVKKSINCHSGKACAGLDPVAGHVVKL
jgi:hypothetical protein